MCPFSQGVRSPLKLNVSGTGAEVLIDAALMPQIQVTNTATGASVETF